MFDKRRKTTPTQTEDENKVKSELKDVDESEDEELLMLQMTGQFSMLPSSIILDILSRLPLKTLCVCRWVCKAWFGFIRLPRFAEMQFAIEIQDRCPLSIVVPAYYKDFHLLDYEFLVNYETFTTAYHLEMKGFDEAFKSGDLPRVYEVVGSVNGLICFTYDRKMCAEFPYYICNPITGEYIILPESPQYEIIAAVSGFGFDSTRNEYKVIRILHDDFEGEYSRDEDEYEYSQTTKAADKHFKAEVEIYTLGSKTWRKIENAPYLTYTPPYNVLVNGNLHWMSHENIQLFQSRVIVSFNVGLEVFEEIQPPPYVKAENYILKCLGVLGDCLCFIDTYSGSRNEIWAMKEYGVHNSWSKEYVFVEEVLGYPWRGEYDVIKLGNGELLMQQNRTEFVYYSPETNSCKAIMLQGISCEWGRRPIVISRSLFSPKNVHKLSKSFSETEKFHGYPTSHRTKTETSKEQHSKLLE